MDGADFRCWDELIPDALGLIFGNLPIQETLTVVPRVCKSWRKSVMDPCSWQEIDLEEWSYRSNHDDIDRMLRMLVSRSCGSLKKLSVSSLQNDLIFAFIADHARSLQTLRLPFSNMTDSIVEQVASKLSTLTYLDLSYCSKIGARSLESIGKHCKSLTTLCWNTHPLDKSGKHPQNDEAEAIASTMPKLKRLEIAYLCVNTHAVLEIVTTCVDLGYLDLRGCWDVKIDEGYIGEKFPRLKVVGPHVVDRYERNDWDECSDYSSDDDIDEEGDSFYEDYESLDEDDERIAGGLDYSSDDDIDEGYIGEKFPRLKVVGPHVVDRYVRNALGECVDYSSDDDIDEEGDSFYEGFDENSSGHGWWPPSP